MPTIHTRLYTALLTLAVGVSSVGAAPAPTASLRYQDIEAIATADVAVYICSQAAPASLPTLKAKLDYNLKDLRAPQAALRAAPAYASIYNSQLNAMLATSKQERIQFCQEAAQ